jgi:hypothetical protein
MSYFSKDELESFTGFGYADFRQSGSVMTATQWSTFVTFLSNAVDESINHFCNVASFEAHTVIEYKNGKGATGENDQYQESDRLYYLIEYATSCASVAEDINEKSDVPDWTDRTVRSATVAGDYEFFVDRELPTIRFHNNIPKEGKRNVRITYTGGYPSDNPALNEIKMIALRIAQNILLIKKKAQESTTLRNTGVRDYSSMFDITSDMSRAVTADIQADLALHRRWRMGGETWD